MRGFLNEIKNVAINRATNKLNNVISDALGGGRTTNPGARGGVNRSSYATLTPHRGKHISYPEDLGSVDQGHFIVFHINEQANANVKFSQGRNLKKASKYSGNEFDDFHQPEKTSISVPKAATKRLEASIAMYMPATVNVSQASQYGEVEIGVLATAAANAVKQGRSEGFFNKEFAKKAFDEAKSAGGDFAEMSLRKAADLIAPGADAAVTLATGKVTNNRLEMVFQGISRRTFSYSFKMMPKSEAEASTVDEIARMFRFYMAPSFDGDIGSSRTMIVPSTFDITYMNMNKENGFLNKISTCVLESCNVTYGGERVQFFRPHSDGSGAPPVETQIDLQFKELEIITREKLALGY